MPFLAECRLVIPAGASLRRGNPPTADKLFYAAADAGLDKTPTEPHCVHKWLDGLSDARTDFLGWLRDTPPSATPRTGMGPTSSADYWPSLRSAWPAAVESCPTALGDELF